MTQFEQFVSRHGEPAVLAILENWERHMGVRASVTEPLSKRWAALMQDSAEDRKAA